MFLERVVYPCSRQDGGNVKDMPLEAKKETRNAYLSHYRLPSFRDGLGKPPPLNGGDGMEETMKRLTYKSIIGGWTYGVPRQEAVDRLAAYEDAMPIERAQELARAEKDERLVVLPCKGGSELVVNGLTFKASHWNVLLSAFADDTSTPSGKRIKLFYPEEAEAALKKREEADNGPKCV